jgi:hypothetical protein
MDKALKRAFEDWYAGEVSEQQRAWIFTQTKGHYTYAVTRAAWLAYEAGAKAAAKRLEAENATLRAALDQIGNMPNPNLYDAIGIALNALDSLD